MCRPRLRRLEIKSERRLCSMIPRPCCRSFGFPWVRSPHDMSLTLVGLHTPSLNEPISTYM